MKRIIFLIFILGTNTTFAQPLKVVTSFSILEDFVKNVGGDKIKITNFVPRNGDAHTYEPGVQDVKQLTDATLVFVSGVGFEGWFQKLVKNSGTKAQIISLSQGINRQKFQDDGTVVEDPHLWWNLNNSVQYVRNIQKALSKVSPVNTKVFQINADRYVQTLLKLDHWAKIQINKIPILNRKLVTNHDAFGYFATRYGLQIIGLVIPSVGTERDPSAKETAALIQAIRQNQVKAIFTENVVSKKLAQAVSEETNIKIAPALYTDALGAIGSSGETFIKAFRYNVTTILNALK